MNKIDVWCSLENDGCGAAFPMWFLTQSEADLYQENLDEGWGEPCIERVETFVGSNVHREAVENSLNNVGRL